MNECQGTEEVCSNLVKTYFEAVLTVPESQMYRLRVLFATLPEWWQWLNELKIQDGNRLR